MGGFAPQANGWSSLKESDEKEPMLLLDVTGSMNYGTSEGDQTPRRDTVREAIALIVRQLGKEDSQAAHEAEGGGLRTVTFAGGKATDIDDINSNNLKQKWASIKWAGGTKILPGWKKIQEVYNEEFGKRPPNKKPVMMLLIITDGEAEDGDRFAAELKRALAAGFGFRIYVTMAIIGYGPDFEDAVRSYKAIEVQTNSHFRVIPFDSNTNPEYIASSLLRMVQ